MDEPLDVLTSGPFPVFRQEWIVHEDADVVVVNKPAGIPCQAADTRYPDDLVTRLRAFLAARDRVQEKEIYLGVHQRLDQVTSGLVLYTRRPEANPQIAAQFEGRRVRKRYLAAVTGYRRGSTTLRGRLVKRGAGHWEVSTKGGKQAVTHVELLKQQGDRQLLALGCETGRTHQLRVQLADCGAPIAGDVRYGGAPAPRLLLHAESLALTHPDGSARSWVAPTPPVFARWLKRGMPENLELAELEVALARAMGSRYRLWLERDRVAPTTAFRLVHDAADGLPGLTVDVYGDYLVANLFDGAFAVQDAVLDALGALGFAGVYVKRHPRQKNELAEAQRSALCPSEPVRGEAAPDGLVVTEYGVPFEVALGDGLRTGLFLDQRENRHRVAQLARGKRLLNLFAYTGGFSVAALHGGAAAALCIDASAAALRRARANVERVAGLDRYRTWTGDVFELLPQLHRRGEQFDVIVLDPPSYATTKRRRFRAAKDYPMLVAQIVPLLAKGGCLLSCLNHHQVSPGRLRALVAQGAAEAGASFESHRDLALPRDFPAAPGQSPPFKSVLSQRG